MKFRIFALLVAMVVVGSASAVDLSYLRYLGNSKTAKTYNSQLSADALGTNGKGYTMNVGWESLVSGSIDITKDLDAFTFETNLGGIDVGKQVGNVGCRFGYYVYETGSKPLNVDKYVAENGVITTGNKVEITDLKKGQSVGFFLVRPSGVVTDHFNFNPIQTGVDIGIGKLSLTKSNLDGYVIELDDKFGWDRDWDNTVYMKNIQTYVAGSGYKTTTGDSQYSVEDYIDTPAAPVDGQGAPLPGVLSALLVFGALGAFGARRRQ